MNINEVFKSVHQGKLEDLIPLKSIENPAQYFEVTGDNIDKILPDYERVSSLYGKDIADNCWYFKSFFPQILYFNQKTFVMIDLQTFFFNEVPSKKLQEYIHEFEEDIQIYGLEGEEVSWRIPSPFQISLLNEYMKTKEINDYEGFISTYINAEFNFSQISKESLLKIFQSPHKRIGEKTIKTLPNCITVYRGEGNKSTPLNEALSWTLDENVAYFFAIKNSENTSFVHKGYIDKEDILDYIDMRNEDEILVLPEKIHCIESTTLLSLEGFLEEYQQEFQHIQNMYKLLKEKYETLLIHNINLDEHDINHVYRVSILTGMLHEKIKADWDEDLLNEDSLHFIMAAGMLHDVGRNHDGEDMLHGKHSVQILKQEHIDLPQYIYDIIEYHCKDDEDFERILTKYDNQLLVQLLYNILKDADALDRTRFVPHDLDINCLREDASREMVLVAKDLLKFKM